MTLFESRASAEFWRLYDILPVRIQQAADKQFAIFEKNPLHPSLHLKQIGKLWSVRVTDAYRAVAIKDKNVFNWLWIGAHDEYERLVNN
jgi:hypothetical protein